jgi:hypothetical protein
MKYINALAEVSIIIKERNSFFRSWNYQADDTKLYFFFDMLEVCSNIKYNA